MQCVINFPLILLVSGDSIKNIVSSGGSNWRNPFGTRNGGGLKINYNPDQLSVSADN